MRIQRLLTAGLSVVLVLGLAGCGNDPLGINEGDQLTAAEIQSLFDAMSAAFAGGGVGASSPVMAAQVPIPIDQSIAFSASCPAGGTVGLNGSANGQIDDQTLEGNLSMNFVYQLNACAVTNNAVTFTVSHAPEIRFEGDFLFGQDEISVTASEQGGFRFESTDGRAGSCLIDLDFSASYNSATQTSSGSVTGTVCGLAADQMTPLDLGGS